MNFVTPLSFSLPMHSIFALPPPGKVSLKYACRDQAYISLLLTLFMHATCLIHRPLPLVAFLSLWVLDVRTKDWFLVDTTSPFLLIGAYLFVVLFWGPWWMSRRRKAHDMRISLFLFNAFLVLLNAYISFELISSATALRFSLFCQPIAYADDHLHIRVCFTCLTMTSRPYA